MNKVKPVIWGIAIIALGVILGGNAIGLFNIDIFFKGWWTLFIIVPSAISLITEKEKVSNLLFLCCSIILLLAAQDVFSYGVAWKVILAMALVVLGGSLIVRNIWHNKNDIEVTEKVKQAKNNKDMDSQMAAFSGSERVYNKEEFTGSNLAAIFGGVELDLRNAVFKKDTVINAFALFGGIEIKVPKDVAVKSKSGFIFGGISDDRKDTGAKSKYTIYIEAAGGFGGISINDKDDKKKK